MGSSTVFRSARLNWGLFLIQWVTFTFVALLLTSFLTSAEVLYRLVNLIPGMSYSSTDPVILLISRVLEGLVVGLAGWLALRTYVNSPSRWLWATLVGEVLSAVATVIVVVTQFSIATRLLGEYTPDDTGKFFLALLLANLDVWLPVALVQAALLFTWVGRRAWWWVLIYVLAGWAQYIFLTLPAQNSMAWAGYMAVALITAAGMVFVLTGRLGQRSEAAAKPSASDRHAPAETRKTK